MRHLWSSLAGVVVAPLTWVLVTLGQDGSKRTIDHWTEVGTYTTANLIEPAVYLGVAGLLLGLLGTLRTSPFGPMVAGLLLVAPYAGMFLTPFGIQDRVPDNWQLFGDPLPLHLPLENGTLFLIGALLLVATFSVQRWRRWPAPVTASTSESPAAARASGADAGSDWSAPAAESGDPDTFDLGLGLGEAQADPLPRRGGPDSPWSTPPRSGDEIKKQ